MTFSETPTVPQVSTPSVAVMVRVWSPFSSLSHWSAVISSSLVSPRVAV